MEPPEASGVPMLLSSGRRCLHPVFLAHVRGEVLPCPEMLLNYAAAHGDSKATCGTAALKDGLIR